LAALLPRCSSDWIPYKGVRVGSRVRAGVPDQQLEIQTYVKRDIRILLAVHDQAQFGRFVALCAALTAQEVNRSQLGPEIGISPQTAERWLNTLKATYQWTEVPAYEGNTVKRLVGRGKGIARTRHGGVAPADIHPRGVVRSPGARATV
jgi:hypothetical protein